MALAISLDKSTFQALSYDELIQLYRYYLINVTPLLVSEILGDLSKEEKEGKKLPKDVVTSLAGKIFPSNTYVNLDYKSLLEMSLLGLQGNYNNRPFLQAAKSVNTGSLKGLVFEETEQEKAIRRWKNGEFNTVDEVISWFWRSENSKENVIEEFRNKMNMFSHLKLESKTGDNYQNLIAIRDMLFEELKREENQKQYLMLIIEYFGLNPVKAGEIVYRWDSEGYKNISEFSGYATFCLKAVALYFVGINNGLFGERKTNLLDMEYLFYTACAKVFSTNDNFLIHLYNLLQPDNVDFISANDLKSDLQKFHAYQIETNSIEDIPPVKDTVTYNLWDKNLDLKLHDFLKKHPKSQEELKKEFDAVLEAAEKGEQGAFDGEPDFVTKEFFMSPEDQCPCGSGKKLKDCHLLKKGA